MVPEFHTISVTSGSIEVGWYEISNCAEAGGPIEGYNIHYSVAGNCTGTVH